MSHSSTRAAGQDLNLWVTDRNTLLRTSNLILLTISKLRTLNITIRLRIRLSTLLIIITTLLMALPRLQMGATIAVLRITKCCRWMTTVRCVNIVLTSLDTTSNMLITINMFSTTSNRDSINTTMQMAFINKPRCSITLRLIIQAKVMVNSIHLASINPTQADTILSSPSI